MLREKEVEIVENFAEDTARLYGEGDADVGIDVWPVKDINT